MGDALNRRLAATFRQELDDQLRAMNADLLVLEREPTNPERLMAVFRGAHTLKGAARAVGLSDIEATCHDLEGLLAEARDGKRVLGADDFAGIFSTLDTLARAGARIGLTEDAHASAATTPRTPAPPPAPSPAPTAAPSSAPSSAPPGRAPPPARPPLRDASGTDVRVGAAKVDALLAAASELMIGQGALAHRAAQARDLHEAAASWSTQWRRSARTVRLALTGAKAAFGGAAERAVHEANERVTRLARESAALAAGLERDVRALSAAVAGMTAHAQEVRLRPIGEACEGLPRAARDLAVAAGKDVAFEVVGGDVEVDRAVLDGLRDALLPLVRNAVDHGVEAPDVRARLGKPRRGRVVVHAVVQGDRVVVTLSDDGAGFDDAAIRRMLEQRGVAAPAERGALARALAAAAGTTRTDVTTISGRGVGLDIVRAAVERVRGTFTVDWAPGAGTTFRIECPPSLATVRAVIATVGAPAVALPVSGVARVARVRPDALRAVGGRPVVESPDGPVPVVPLARVLGPPYVERPLAAPGPGVILASGSDRLVVLVDELVAEEEIVLRPVAQRGDVRGMVGGATILGTGAAALVLDVPTVVATGIGAASRAGVAAAIPASHERRRTVLVVDDSITTRTLEQTVLEAAGYDVLTAADGADAWRVLQERGADLVVADVEMPRMDGVDLTAAIRASKRFREVPVILVSALESDAHRRRGLEAGADAYLGKSGFDQQRLLDAIRQLLD